MSEIKIRIQDKEYTIEEARKLYQELNELFKEKEYLPYVPFPPQYPEPIPMTPYYITCSSREDK